MAQWAKSPPAALAACIGASLSPGYFTSGPVPCCWPGKSRERQHKCLHSATNVRDLEEAPDFDLYWGHLGSGPATGGSLSFPLFVTLFQTNKQTNKSDLVCPVVRIGTHLCFLTENDFLILHHNFHFLSSGLSYAHSCDPPFSLLPHGPVLGLP